MAGFFTPRTEIGPGRRAGIALWLLCTGLLLAGIAVFEWRTRITELSLESARLHAIASQRADQHDAHLTALSAVAVAGADQRPDLFREVAGAIMRFYPRITRILLVPLDEKLGTLEIGKEDVDLRDAVRSAARRSTGAPELIKHPSGGAAYLIVKRSPNNESARYGLALVIDAAALLSGESDYWGSTASALRLTMPDGTLLVADGGPIAAPHFSRALSSGTQPLRLETAVALNFAALFPPGPVAFALALTTLAAFGVRAVRRQRARVRAAERRAELSGLETRLGHAARVNALGEMASGMAHELTQPLTAILAQAQAARHLAARGEAGRVAGVLEDVVVQTRRASAILERLRTWTRPRDRHTEPIDLRDCIRVAESLLARQIQEEDVRLGIRLPDAEVPVVADRIELEQVVFNLLKNALDAVDGIDGAREVTVSLAVERGAALLDVEDSGTGVREDIRDRLFTPFVTTREGGTGLGLALSLRLVERAGGDLTFIDRPRGARFRITLPLAGQRREAAE